MNIQWLGHSCFLFTSDSGVRILTDPFDENVGYKTPSVQADVVLTSHDHFDHNAINLVKGNPEIIKDPGKYMVKGINIAGVLSFHDATSGSQRGRNIIFLFKMDNMFICHLGDLGHILQPEQLKDIGAVVDILLIPVGGFYTINAKQADEVIEQVKPKIIIPMHYKTSVIKIPIESVDKFLLNKPNVRYIDSNGLKITYEQLPDKPCIFVLRYE